MTVHITTVQAPNNLLEGKCSTLTSAEVHGEVVGGVRQTLIDVRV